MTDIIPSPLLNMLMALSVGLSALSGALLAAKLRQTFVTMAFFALVTGVGGGTVRDILIGVPVFWINDPWVAAICLSTAFLAWFTPTKWWEGLIFEYADALGLAAYAVLGSTQALSTGAPPIPAALVGVITGCAGGIIRDMVAGRPSIIIKPELYVTAAALSAGLCVMLSVASPLADWEVWASATLAGFLLRCAAIRYKLALPAYAKED